MSMYAIPHGGHIITHTKVADLKVASEVDLYDTVSRKRGSDSDSFY